MTDQGLQFPRFFVTAPAQCPYLQGKTERKVFTELRGPDAGALNESLGRVGFRRSQSVAYRPACEDCAACISVRVCVSAYTPRKSIRRVIKANTDIKSAIAPPLATEEQYNLLSHYLKARHGDGSMADMTMADYREMVETSPVQTILIEYRRIQDNQLIAVALTDEMSDGLSMIYSFFDPDSHKRSLGSYIITDHLKRCGHSNMPYLYLGYWVKGSQKMSYKERFKPLEGLGNDGWHPLK